MINWAPIACGWSRPRTCSGTLVLWLLLTVLYLRFPRKFEWLSYELDLSLRLILPFSKPSEHPARPAATPRSPYLLGGELEFTRSSVPSFAGLFVSDPSLASKVFLPFSEIRSLGSPDSTALRNFAWRRPVFGLMGSH